VLRADCAPELRRHATAATQQACRVPQLGSKTQRSSLGTRPGKKYASSAPLIRLSLRLAQCYNANQWSVQQ